MAEETDVIREQIEQTRGKLTENLAELEATVENTLDRVRSGVRQLSPVEQAKIHPFAATAASLAAGVVVGGWVARQSPSAMADSAASGLAAAKRRTASGLSFIRSEFDEEIATVKGLAFGAFLRGLGNVVKQALPAHADTIEQTVERAVEKANARFSGDSPEEGREYPPRPSRPTIVT